VKQNDVITSNITVVFRLILDNPELELVPSMKMGDSAEWDSFVHINLIIALESEFDIEFDSEEIGSLLSVDQIVNAVTEKVFEKSRF
jgi:acyl carrier protein